MLLAENWPPRLGGIENYLTSIASGLTPGSVVIVAPQTDGKDDQQTSELPGVVRKRFFWPLLKPAWLPLFFAVKKLVRDQKIDMLFCGKALFEGLLAYHVKKSLGTPYVVFTYAMEIAVWAKSKKRQLQKVLLAADRVVYINDVTKKTLLELGVQEKQLVKIWPGISDDWFKEMLPEDVNNTLKRYNLTSPYILTGARLIERKGIDTVIEAFGKLNKNVIQQFQLVIFGDGPQAKSLKELAQKQSSNIIFLGRVPKADLPALYQGATMFVLAPREIKEDMEGFGIVYLEAGARDLPVIGTLTGGIPEAILHKQTGILVQPDSPSGLAEAMELLIKDEPMRKTMGQAGKQRAWNEFRWSKRILLVKGMIDAMMAEKVLSARQRS